MRPLLLTALVLLAGGRAAGGVEISPKVGIDFEHFGETYRVDADQDTVAAFNDYGTLVGLTVRTPGFSENWFRFDGEFHAGQATRRLRLDFEGGVRRGANRFEIDQEAQYRVFSEDGDYSLSSDYVQEYFRVGWERRLSDDVRLRFRETFDLTWYQESDAYNVTNWVQRPGVDLRVGFRELDELRLGYRWGTRTAPDSTAIEYDRHTIDAEASLLFGWTASLDVANRVDRRDYAAGSPRPSYWENRLDATLRFDSGDRATFRLVHENEVLRNDVADELDFDYSWARTGFQVEIHGTRDLDLSVEPVYAFLTSGTAPAEEYSETGVEFGMDLRLGTATWISLTDEVGRRNYEVAASATDSDAGTLSDSGDLLGGVYWSDYLYNRLTLLVTTDVTAGVSFNLFANWQPEDHRVSSDDTDTRMISGGLEYRF